MTEPAVRAQGLSKHFGDVVAAEGIDLEIPAGRIFGFLGPNGSGKTTIIRMLCGLLTPTSGEVSILGIRVPEDAEELRHRIGYMTQKFSLYEELSTTENMRFLGRIFGMEHRDIRQRIDELLDRYNLETLRDRRPSAMSGGQRQRLALAAATLHRPDLLFLDEPTSAVDPENRRDFWEKLFDLVEDGSTILVSTHYMDEAERCHELAILETGSLRKCGAPSDLMGELERRVLEVSGPDLRRVRTRLLESSAVQSAAQQGMHLRVLLRDTADDPVAVLQRELGDADLRVAPARPSLEDVFVAATAGYDKR